MHFHKRRRVSYRCLISKEGLRTSNVLALYSTRVPAPPIIRVKVSGAITFHVLPSHPQRLSNSTMFYQIE